MVTPSKPLLLVPLLLPALLLQSYVHAQHTLLDDKLLPLYRPLRNLITHLTSGYSSDDHGHIERVRSMGKTQRSGQRARSLTAFCDAKNGPGKRSAHPPSSVHRLRPGDIDIIGAMGDSLTAGTGIFASRLSDLLRENRGAVFSIGGQGTWCQFLTLPNILKEFNPNLYGYSLRDGFTTDRSSKFNVAELGAMSRDVPYEAKMLVKRLQRDPKVNMTHDWKLFTLLIGANDFCTDICYQANPKDTIKWHEQNMLTTYRYLRDNVPHLLLNVVLPPNLGFLARLTGLPAVCRSLLPFTCPCMYGKNKTHLEYFEGIIKEWIAKDFEVAARDEFNTETFTINVQPFSFFEDFIRRSNGFSDTHFMSEDCFHLSQLGQAAGANGLWNNMLEAANEKSSFPSVIFEKFRCPTEARPYLITRMNSDQNFQLPTLD